MASSNLVIVFLLLSLCLISTPAIAHNKTKTKVVPDHCRCICEKPNYHKSKTRHGAKVTATAGVTAGATVTGTAGVTNPVVLEACKKTKYVDVCHSTFKSSEKTQAAASTNAVAQIAVSKMLTQATEISVKFEKFLQFSQASTYQQSYKSICSRLGFVLQKLEKPGCRRGDVMTDLNAVMSEINKCEGGFSSFSGASFGASFGASVGASSGASAGAQGAMEKTSATAMNVELKFMCSNAISICQGLPA